MKTPLVLTIATAAFMASLTTTSAAESTGAWSFSLKGGTTLSTSGGVHQGPSFDGSVLLGLPANSLPVVVEAKSFDDVYGNFTEFGVEANYEANTNLSYSFGLSQLTAGEGNLRVGTVAGSLPLNGRFSKYQDLQAYVGIRYNLNMSERWNPYFAAQIGYKRIDEINASFSVPNTPFNQPYQDALTNAKFYDSTNVWAFGALVGLEYKINDTALVALETGYLTQGGLDDNDSIVGLLGLNSLNDEGDLSYIPIRLSVRFRF